MSEELDVRRLFDGAERRLDQDGYDPVTVLGMALERLAEEWADDERALCPECQKRRVTRGHDWCKWCEQQRDADRMDKLEYWHRVAGPARAAARAALRSRRA